MFFKNLTIKIKSLFNRTNCNNVHRSNNHTQKTVGFGNNSTISNTTNNYNGEKSGISLKGLESQEKLVNLFTKKTADWIVSQIKDPRRNPHQPDAGCIKWTTNHFDNIQDCMQPCDAKAIFNLKEKALAVLHQFIDTKDSYTFINDWIEIGIKLKNIFNTSI